MRYQDFIVQIGRPEAGRCAVTVLQSPAGHGESVFEIPEPAAPEPAGLASFGRDLAASGTGGDGSPPERLGARLFDALMTGQVRDRYFQSLGLVAGDRTSGGLRLQLRLSPASPELLDLPWELLYQPDARGFLCLSRRTPVVRSLDVPGPVARPPLPERLRLLAVVASPPGLPPLDLEAERRWIEAACREQPRIELSVLANPTAQALRRELLAAESRREPIHVLHFMGHGQLDARGEGALLFAGEDGAPDAVLGEELSTFVRDFTSLELVVLNACRSGESGGEDPFAGVAAALLVGGLPAVLAMRAPISDEGAIAFSRAFYQRLAAGEPVDTAVTEGRLALYRKGRPSAEWGTPVLFLRGGDGRLFRSEDVEEALTLADYLARLWEGCEEAFSGQMVRPDRFYVPQLGSRRSERGADEDGGGAEMLAALQKVWSGGPRPGKAERVAVLGSYGMGKSYLAWKTVLEQAEGLDPARGRLPILFPLKQFRAASAFEEGGRRRDLIDQVLEHAMALDFPRMGRADFVRWIETGRVGIVLDGLDELALPRDVSWQSVVSPLAALVGASLVLTSRTAWVADPGRDLAGWEVWDLLDWGEREWGLYLDRSAETLARAGGPERFRELVAGRPQLSQLTTRPLWCSMIVAVCEEIQELADLGLSGLYQRFLDRAIKRRALPGLILSLAWRFCAMERFAETCIRQGRASLREPQVVEMLSALFETVGETQLRDYLTLEARTYSFLNCDRYRWYSFGHASFEDYFAAAAAVRGLAREVGFESGPAERPRPEPLAAERDLTDDQVAFAAGILQEEAIVRSLQMVPAGVPASQLTTRILLHLQEVLSSGRDPAALRRNLFRLYLLLLRGAGGARPRLRRLDLARLDLSGVDLSGCDLQEIDWTEANLHGARFAESTLEGCSFFGATLDGCDFTDADLAAADLTGIERPREPPILAGARNLDRARLGARERELLGAAG